MNSPIIPEEARQRFHSLLTRYLPEQLADELLSRHTSITYAKDCILFFQGSPADLMFWIISGLVKIYCPTPDGRRTLIKLRGPGDLLGYADFIESDGQRTQAFEAQALSKCTVALLTREHVVKMLEKLDKATLIRLLEQLNTSWSTAVYSYAISLGSSFRQRLSGTLQELASRFGVHDKRGILLPMRLSQADLAEMISGSRPVVTRLIAEMIAEQSLYRHGKQYIVPNAQPGNGAAKLNTGGNRIGKKSEISPRQRRQTRLSDLPLVTTRNGFRRVEERP
jgi:CRP/FNR family transcriptional regulator